VYTRFAAPLAAVALLAAMAAAEDDGSSRDGPAPPPAGPAATAPTHDPSPSSLGASFDGELLRDLPGGRRAWSVLETLDATAVLDRIDGGGLYTGEPEALGIHGASWTQVSYRLGDLDITDPDATGTPLFLPDPAVLESMTLVSGLAPAEQGGQGPVVTFVPRRPGGSWHGSAAGDLLPVGVQAAVPSGPPAVARYDALAAGRFRLDGPLVKDRLGLLVSGSWAQVRRFEGADPTPLEGSEASLLAHLVWTAGVLDEVRFLGGFQRVRHPYAGRARFDPADVGESDRLLNMQATWERRGSTHWAVTGGYVRGAFHPDLGGRSPGATVERLLDGPVPLLFAGDGSRERGTLGARVDRGGYGFAGGQHDLRAGLSASWSRAATGPAETRGLTAESVNGLPARLWDYGWEGPESRWRAFDLAAYAADGMRYGRVSLDAGLRLELTRGSAEGGPGEVRWSALCPRVSARANLTSGGGLAFRAGYARYRSRLPLSLLAFGDPAAAQGLVYRWLDRNGNGIFDPREQGPLVAALGPGGPSASIDSGLKPPHTDEIMVGLETRIGRSWTASLLGVRRREQDLVASVNVGAPLSAYTVSFVPDPGGDIVGPEDDQLLPVYDRRPESFGQDRYVLTSVGDNALHEGVEIALRGTVGERLRVFLGGTASRTDGPGGNRGFRAAENDQGVIGERLEDPNATTYSRGRLFFDRAFTLKLAASYRAPGNVRVASVARYQDGQPFSRLVIPARLSQGPDPVQAIPNGRSRFTYTLTVDGRLEKGFGIGRARLAAALEVFNLLDMASEVEEDVTWGPSFRATTLVQPPRAFLLELRLDF
jgi:hypothetical protein